jgi:UDP-glucuronate 4-epimerase
MTRVLLTGIAGFIGSHFAERLLNSGHDVVGLDNFDPSYDRRIKEQNLDAIRSHARIVEGDLCDAELVDATVRDTRPDVVVHLAALAGVRPSIAEPARYQRVNVVGTANLAQAMVDHGVERMIFASSSSVYGDNAEVPYREDHRVDLPASPYASSKRACELLLRTFHRVHQLHSCSLRFFTVYGPRQRPEMAIHKFCRLILDGEPITMFGDGSSSRDYTYIDDIVDGMDGALNASTEGCTIYNLGGTSPVKLRELITAIGEALGTEPRVEELPMQPGDVLHTWADVTAAQRDFGYNPQVSLQTGLSRFVSWLKEKRNS